MTTKSEIEAARVEAVEPKRAMLRVRAAVCLYRTSRGWQAVVEGYEMQPDEATQRTLDDSLKVEVLETASEGDAADVMVWRWIEADVPLPVEDEPVVEGEVVP